MKKLKIVAPIAVAAGAAAAVVLGKKGDGKGAEKGAAKGAAKGGAPALKNAKTGTYSFLSGYRDPVTVEVSIDYDSVNSTYAVVEEDFLAYTSDSHVASMHCTDFDMQLEYASYYSGEDFAATAQAFKEKYNGFAEVTYGANKGFKFVDGDNHCMCFPIAGDEFSYILVTVIKAKDSKVAFEDLPQLPELVAMLSSVKFATKA